MSDRFSFLIIKLSIRAASDSAQVSYKYKVQLLYRLFAWGCSCWKWIYWACWQKDILFDKSCYAIFDAYHMSCVAWHHNSQTVRARKLNFQRIGPLGQFFLCVKMLVCLSVCLFVRDTFCFRLTVFLHPLPKVQCPNFLDIRNPWGKVIKRNGLRFEQFCSKLV